MKLKLKNKIKLDPRLNFIKDPIFQVVMSIWIILMRVYYYFSFDEKMEMIDLHKKEIIK